MPLLIGVATSLAVFVGGWGIEYLAVAYGQELQLSALPSWRWWVLVAAAVVVGGLVALALRQWLRLYASEQQFRELVQGVNGVVLRWDAAGIIRFINAYGEQLFGYDAGEMIGRRLLDTLVPERDRDGRDLRALLAGVLRDPAAYAVNENEVLTRDGTRLLMLWSNRALRGPDGHVQEILSIGHDHTRRREAELELEHVTRYLTAVTEAIPDIGFVLDDQGRYVDVFGGYDSVLYHEGRILVGCTFHEVLPAEVADRFLAVIHQALWEQRLVTVEYPLAAEEVVPVLERSGPSGEQWFEGRVYPLPGGIRGRPAVVWLAHNITERKRAEEQVRYLALHDALTGLANRSLFQDRLQQALELASRQDKRIGLLFVDLDGFKPVNDRYGHHVGDRLLCYTAQRLEQQVRSSDTVARFGGDEFAVLLQDVHGVEDVEQVADKVLAALCEPMRVEEIECAVGASVGVSLYPEHGTACEELLQAADQAMYRAKADKRGGYRMAASAAG